MKSFITMAIALLLGSAALADNSGTVTCKSQSGEVVMTIRKVADDAQGEAFQAVIYKNGKILRNDTQSPIYGKGEFTIYTNTPDAGWKFRVSTHGSTTMGFIQSQSMYGTLEKQLGSTNNILYCNQPMPLKSWMN